MKVVLVEPFGHRGGHHPIEARMLASALVDSDVVVEVITAKGFKDVPGFSNATGWTHKSVLHDGTPIRRFLLSASLHGFHMPTLLAVFETLFALMMAGCVAKKNNAQVILLVSGSLIGFLLYSMWPHAYGQVFILRDWRRYALHLANNTNPVHVTVQNVLLKLATRINRGKLTFTHIGGELDKAYRATGFSTTTHYVPPVGIDNKKYSDYGKTQAREHLNLPIHGVILLVFGKGHYGKDFETILKSMQREIPGVNVVFAGKSAGANSPTELAAKYNVNQGLIIRDQYIAQDKVPLYFRAADGVLMSYKKDFVVDSGVMALAIEHGVPIIASDVGEIGRNVKEYGLGLTFDVENSGSLSAAISKFLQLKEDQKLEIDRSIESFRSGRSWGSIANLYIRVFQTVIPSSG